MHAHNTLEKKTLTLEKENGCQQLSMAKRYLDEHCPLEFGSHCDVTNYVVYYHHLMAFFSDGSHCGLKCCQQFVALCGHKETPQALLLKNEAGQHIEISLDQGSYIGAQNEAHIDDVQMETALSVVSRAPSDNKLWLSFIHGVQTSQATRYYTDKMGNDYQV